jgi:hypothetical protein
MPRRKQCQSDKDILRIDNEYSQLAMHYLARCNVELEKARRFAEMGGISDEGFDAMMRAILNLLAMMPTFATRN